MGNRQPARASPTNSYQWFCKVKKQIWMTWNGLGFLLDALFAFQFRVLSMHGETDIVQETFQANCYRLKNAILITKWIMKMKGMMHSSHCRIVCRKKNQSRWGSLNGLMDFAGFVSRFKSWRMFTKELPETYFCFVCGVWSENKWIRSWVSGKRTRPEIRIPPSTRPLSPKL